MQIATPTHMDSNILSDYLSSPLLFLETFVYIQDKMTGSYRPFKLNSIQRELYEWLMWNHFKKAYNFEGDFIGYRFQGIRMVLCKSRQLGGSTLFNALYFWDTIFFEGVRTMIYCQDGPSSKVMLTKWKDFINFLPDYFPLRRDLDNVNEITFPEMRSVVECSSPGSSAQTQGKQGRSKTIRNVLCSEFSEWPNPLGTLDGLAEAVMMSGNIIVEASPKYAGDDFNQLYETGKPDSFDQEKIKDDGLEGEVRNFNQDWRSYFIPWFNHYENRVELKPKEVTYLEENLTQEEIKLVKAHELDMEQVAFRRKKISSKRGDMAKFYSEYPEDDVTAFQGASGLFFPLPCRKTTCEPRWARRGHLHGIGADVALGIEEGGDYSTISVVDVQLMEQIFEWHGHCPPEKLAGLIYLTWLCYPGLVGIESNTYGQTTLKEARGFDWMEPEPFLYTNSPTHGGFYQTKQTKFQGLTDLKNALLDRVNGNPGLAISSPYLVKEMGWIKRTKDGSIGAPDNRSKSKTAQKKTDDLAIATMIAYQMALEIDYVTRAALNRFGDDYLFIPNKPLPELFEDYLDGKISFEDSKVEA